MPPFGLRIATSSTNFGNMNLRAKEKKEESHLDPVLFAATVPSRKPTAKDLADCQEKPDDAIEPKEFQQMDEMLEDL